MESTNVSTFSDMPEILEEAVERIENEMNESNDSNWIKVWNQGGNWEQNWRQS